MAVRIIKWIRQWGGTDRIGWISVPKLDAAWRADWDYLSPAEAASQQRYHKFGKWLVAHSERVQMPHICLFDNGIAFTDGRHRFAWFRDHGVKALPVTAEPEEAPTIRRRYGTRSRTTRLPN